MNGEQITAFEAQREEAIFEIEEADSNLSDLLAAQRQGVR